MGDSIRKKVFTSIGFTGGLTALCTIIIPALSMLLAVVGIVFSALAFRSEQKWMARSGLAMSIMALIFDLIYLYVTIFA